MQFCHICFYFSYQILTVRKPIDILMSHRRQYERRDSRRFCAC